MTRRDFLKATGGAAAASTMTSAAPAGDGKLRRPNFIIIFTDDQGYNDLSCFASKQIRTLHIDRMAAEGGRLTNFYAQPLCGPSRAALLTGSYPLRVAVPGNVKNHHTILHQKEVTIAGVLKAAGYATIAIGKWHVAGSGEQAIAGPRGGKNGWSDPKDYKARHPELMPPQKGFDAYFGIPYSNDMRPPVLMRDNKVIENPVEQTSITTRYTDEALKFIRANRAEPFFLYLAHNMPHTPLHPSAKFAGRSPYGLYGDAVEEIDWNTGRILSELADLGIDANTWVIYCSDNGPWIEAAHNREGPRYQAGLADPRRGAKMTTWDGGPRVPCVMRWPGTLPAGRGIDEIATTMDFLPSFAKQAGATPPTDRIIDGKDILPLLTGHTDTSPHEAYYFHKATQLQAVRSGKWKLVLPKPAKPFWLGWYARLQQEVKTLELYDLSADISERRNVADEHPDVVKRLLGLIEKSRADLGDCDRIGAGARFFDDAPKRPGIQKCLKWAGEVGRRGEQTGHEGWRRIGRPIPRGARCTSRTPSHNAGRSAIFGWMSGLCTASLCGPTARRSRGIARPNPPGRGRVCRRACPCGGWRRGRSCLR